jgi:hypothetical protein
VENVNSLFGLCCVGFMNRGVVTGVRRQSLTLSIDPN